MEESDGRRRAPCRLPERFFAVGEEPTGVRVTPYHKADVIRQILKALTPDEIEDIRVSPFGKLIETADQPSFSGRFGRYILSRQLKVLKKHEAWFLFAGKLIRFSIREFAMVTGLNCKKFPKRMKKKSFKNSVGEKPYWFELFGTLTNILVSSVIKILQRNTVSDREMRLKYAYLAILSAVILPTTHTPRISTQAAEMIKDLDVFFAYPWGRVSFSLLMTSIKERKEVALLQNTIALKGFVLSLQLVMIACVPALTEVVDDGSSSASEDEDHPHVTDKGGKKSISPAHARDIDAAGKALVQSIMLDENGETNLDPEYEWTDDEQDLPVSNMVNLINDQHTIFSEYFVGGSTIYEASRMREEVKADVVNRKTGKSKASSSSQNQDGLDVDMVANLVREKLKDDFEILHGSISKMQESLTGYTDTILVNFGELYTAYQESIAKMTTLSDQLQNIATPGAPSSLPRENRRPTVVDASTQTQPDAATIISDAINFVRRSNPEVEDEGDTNADAPTVVSGETEGCAEEIIQPSQGTPLPTRPAQDLEGDTIMETCSEKSAEGGVEAGEDLNLDSALLFPNPTFSLGLTQEERLDLRNKDKTAHLDPNAPNVDQPQSNIKNRY